jgi:hypothetical protein
MRIVPRFAARVSSDSATVVCSISWIMIQDLTLTILGEPAPILPENSEK